MPEELLQKIDDHRAEQAAEDGTIKNRSEWIREAAWEKLGIDYTNDGGAEDQKGAA
jgi:metal-responsive CopG/Arc/MetJ family transcriptional regulator